MSTPVSPTAEPVRRCKHDVSEDCPACAEETIAGLKARAEQAEQAVDLLESNARVQAKLLADTGRKVEELKDVLLAVSAMDAHRFYVAPMGSALRRRVEAALSPGTPAVSR